MSSPQKVKGRMAELESHLLTLDGRGVEAKRAFLEEYVALRAADVEVGQRIEGWAEDAPDDDGPHFHTQAWYDANGFDPAIWAAKRAILTIIHASPTKDTEEGA